MHPPAKVKTMRSCAPVLTTTGHKPDNACAIGTHEHRRSHLHSVRARYARAAGNPGTNAAGK
jgi:hypothetical protein